MIDSEETEEERGHDRRKRLAGVTIEVPAHWSAKRVPKGTQRVSNGYQMGIEGSAQRKDGG